MVDGFCPCNAKVEKMPCRNNHINEDPLSVNSARRLRNIQWIKASSILVVVLVLTPLGQRNAAAEGKWFVCLYGGQVTDGSIGDAFTPQDDYKNSYLGAFVFGKEFWTYKDYIGMEAEGQIVKHWELQDHFEFNALLVIRWLPFPWDDHVDTSFALGNGISYATEDPEIEEQAHDNVSKILHYLMLELSFLLPNQAHWNVFVRLHHRSGVFGLYNGVSGASNALGAGVRYTF
jgi:hypothetical protein